MRKISALFSFLALFIFVNPILAQESNTAVGVNFLGSEISGNFKISDQAALRLDLDFVFIDLDNISVDPALLFYQNNKASDLEGNITITPYHGPGAYFTFWIDPDNDTTYGFQYFLGFEAEVTNAPINFFMDAGPAISFNDGEASLFGLTSSFGFRYRL